IGISDKAWADQLFFTINVSEDYKETQHGPRMIMPYGERFSEGWTVAPAVSYRKDNAGLDGLNISLDLQYAVSQRSTVDTTSNRYDWYGNPIPGVSGVSRLPGESGTATLNVNDNKNYVARAGLSYSFNN